MVDLESKTPDGDNERHKLIVALIGSGITILVIVPAGCIVYFCFCKKRFSSLRRHRGKLSLFWNVFRFPLTTISIVWGSRFSYVVKTGYPACCKDVLG